MKNKIATYLESYEAVEPIRLVNVVTETCYEGAPKLLNARCLRVGPESPVFLDSENRIRDIL